MVSALLIRLNSIELFFERLYVIRTFKLKDHMVRRNKNISITVIILFSYLLIATSIVVARNGFITYNQSNNHIAYAFSVQNLANDTSSSSNTAATATLIVKLLANNLENHLQKAGAILNITAKLPQVRNTSFAYMLNQTLSTLHGIPQNADTEKREIAKDILASDKDFQVIVFIMPNGDIYFGEPYSRQQVVTTTNLAFRDYFQGAIKTNDTFLGNVITSASTVQREALIAVPVYSLKEDNTSAATTNTTTIAGVWAGVIDFNVLTKELQSLNLTSTEGERVVYVGHNGNKIADSDANKSNIPESFANLTSFRNAAINGQSGTTIETIDNTKMIITYQPVKIFHNTWAILLMRQLPSSPSSSNQTLR